MGFGENELIREEGVFWEMIWRQIYNYREKENLIII